MNRMYFLPLAILLASFSVLPVNTLAPYSTPGCDDFVELSTCLWDNSNYRVVMMNRADNHVRAKYFAAKDFNNNTVYERYKNWKAGKKVILVSSGTYMDALDAYYANPVGLCIDNGILVNQTLSDKFDGLVIVQATGGIAVSNIKEGNLSIVCNGENKTFDIRNAYQRAQFVECAKSVEATVFQTHLLAYRNNVLIKRPDGSSNTAKTATRRFLAACKDVRGNLYHIIIHVEKQSTLYDASEQVFSFLQRNKGMTDVIYMLNLDTGAQDVFSLYDCDGTMRDDIKGSLTPDRAINLLVYYYQ